MSDGEKLDDLQQIEPRMTDERREHRAPPHVHERPERAERARRDRGVQALRQMAEAERHARHGRSRRRRRQATFRTGGSETPVEPLRAIRPATMTTPANSSASR